MTYTVYGIVDPRSKLFVYVGETGDFDRRRREHLTTHRLRKKTPPGSIKTWLKRLHKDGLEPGFVVLDVVETESESKNVESKWVEKLAGIGHPLRNLWDEHKELIQEADQLVAEAFEPLIFKGRRPKAVGSCELNASKTGYRIYIDKGVEITGPVTIDLVPRKSE